MANTYSSTYLHYVFSTKNRKRYLDQDKESRIWQYIGGIIRTHGLSALQIGGIEDHLHALIRSLPKYSPSQIGQFMKAESSRWIKEEFEDLRSFGWQDGYGVFSVSKSQLDKVVRYIRDQREHHANKSFEEEYRELLDLHDVDYDERYLFG